MTDHDKLIELLEGFGIGYNHNKKHVFINVGHENVKGCPECYMEFLFDENSGKFIEVSIRK